MAVRLRLARLESHSPLRGALRRAAARLSPQLLPVVARQPWLAAETRSCPRPGFRRQLPRRRVPHRRPARGGGVAPPVAARNGARRLRAALGEGRRGRGNAAGGSLFRRPPADYREALNLAVCESNNWPRS